MVGAGPCGKSRNARSADEMEPPVGIEPTTSYLPAIAFGVWQLHDCETVTRPYRDRIREDAR